MSAYEGWWFMLLLLLFLASLVAMVKAFLAAGSEDDLRWGARWLVLTLAWGAVGMAGSVMFS